MFVEEESCVNGDITHNTRGEEKPMCQCYEPSLTVHSIHPVCNHPGRKEAMLGRFDKVTTMIQLCSLKHLSCVCPECVAAGQALIRAAGSF